MTSHNSDTSMAAPSAAMPDEFDRMTGVLDGVSTSTDPAIVFVVPTLGVGGTRKFILRTVRHEGRDHLFVEFIARDRSFREYFPPEVMTVIARQHDALTAKNRRLSARREAARRQKLGLKPNVAGLRAHAAKRAKKGGGR
jgi:hypothetical protein